MIRVYKQHNRCGGVYLAREGWVDACHGRNITTKPVTRVLVMAMVLVMVHYTTGYLFRDIKLT